MTKARDTVLRMHHAYAVLYLDRNGKVVDRGIFSERTPTLVQNAYRTQCVAEARSRIDYGRARRALESKLGGKWSKGFPGAESH